MQLAGPGVFGRPRDRAAAIEVLRTAVELGVNHIDTADAYGPYITNEIIREALFPYGDHMHIVTKVGVVRDERGGWLPANSPESLRAQVQTTSAGLGSTCSTWSTSGPSPGIDDRVEVPDTLVPQFEALAELQQQGLIGHLGLSTVSLDQLAEAQQIAPVVCVQNFYNIANRADAAVLAATAEQHIAYVPYFPLGGFSPLQSDVLESVAKRLVATPTAVAQSWLLQHSPNILLIPGTSSVAHLRENIAGAALSSRPTPSPSWTRSEQWTPTEQCGSRPVCSSPLSAQGGDRNGNRATGRCAQPPQIPVASRFARPSGAMARVGRNQRVHGCPREIGAAVLRTRESP